MSAKEEVLKREPQAVAQQDPKHKDWAIFARWNSFLGYGTTESDAWRDAEARLKEAEKNHA